MIRLEPVTPDNWRPGLTVSEEQTRFVADATTLLARAYAFRESRSRACLICDGETPVGMALYYDCEPLRAFDFSQLFIDRRYQGRGYGRAAAQLLLDEMARDGRYGKVVLCFIDGNDAARRLYESLGFAPTGERDGDEIVMEKSLR